MNKFNIYSLFINIYLLSISSYYFSHVFQCFKNVFQSNFNISIMLFFYIFVFPYLKRDRKNFPFVTLELLGAINTIN